MRKLALDIGAKSCGIAISDPFNLFAQGIENFRFSQEDWDELIKKIKSLLKIYEIDTIVVGYPTFPSGDPTKTAQLIDKFVRILKKSIKISIVFINENYSTKKAQEIMHQGNLTAKKQKRFQDKLAAQLILDDYLMTLKVRS